MGLTLSGLTLSAQSETTKVDASDRNGQVQAFVVADKSFGHFEKGCYEFLISGKMLDIKTSNVALEITFNGKHASATIDDLGNGSIVLKSIVPQDVLTIAIKLAQQVPVGTDGFKALRNESFAALGALINEQANLHTVASASGNPVNYAAYAACYYGCAFGGGGWYACGNYCGKKFLDVEF